MSWRFGSSVLLPESSLRIRENAAETDFHDIVGLLAAGPFGAIAGLLIGHIVDSVHRVKRFVGGTLKAVQSTFFETTFTLMGHIAKSDGRISEQARRKGVKPETSYRPDRDNKK